MGQGGLLVRSLLQHVDSFFWNGSGTAYVLGLRLEVEALVEGWTVSHQTP